MAVGTATSNRGGAAEPARADGRALQAVFEERFLAENVFHVRRRAAEMRGDAKFRYLLEWVMPGPKHSGFRLAGDFTPNSPPPVIEEGRETCGRPGDPAIDSTSTRGGDLVSPAFDLVDVAKELGKLDELLARLEQLDAGVQSNHERRARASLRLLIAVAQDHPIAAKAAFGDLFDRFRESQHAEAAERWPETLALSRGVDYPATRDIAGELLYMVYDMYVADRRGWRSLGVHNWDHWFFSTLGLHKHQTQYASPDRFGAAPPLENWVPVSYSTFITRGKGLPFPHWSWTGQQIVKLSGHAKDYLFYRIPLRGDFEVECELTQGAWRSTELLLAGTWVSPQWSREDYAVGTAREQEPRRDLDQPLTEFDEWGHYRAVVRDQVCTIYFNGRAIHRETLPDESDPWLAIRSEARSHGAIRNLRITGRPTVPASIYLAALPSLPGWIPYHAYEVGPQSNWRHAQDLSGASGIVGRHNPPLRGAMRENLLRYFRPMLEDGTIEYEFFHEAGAVDVHPALDRLAFLVEPQGVDIHWITDDRYDRTELDPTNRCTERGNRRGPAPLPLQSPGWNRLGVTLQGDTVRLELNGVLIYERALEPTNQRTFGLFHYGDQSEARVRNIVWRGDWPKQAPPVAEQELAWPDHECLLDLEPLEEVFSHDFAAKGIPAESFEIAGPVSEESVAITSRGLHIVPAPREAFTTTRVAYRQPIYGDFDATLEFENLKTTYGGRGVIGLEFNAVDDTDVIIGSARLHRDKGISSTAKMSVPLPDGSRRYTATHVADESEQGRLRLVRRGATIHALIAHGDSVNFRHLGSHRLPSAGTAVALQAHIVSVANGAVGVVLKEFTVRSNSSAIQRRIDPRVASLNQYTLGLPRRERHSFATGHDGFLTSGKPQVVARDGGLEVRSHAAGQGEASVAYRRELRQDFDVLARFEELSLPESAPAANELALSLAIAGEQPAVARVTISRASSGKLQLTARLQPEGAAGGQAADPIATIEVDSADGLRLARIQRTLFFLYSEEGYFRLLGMADVGPGEVKSGALQFTAHGSGQAPIKVLLTTFEARASRLID